MQPAEIINILTDWNFWVSSQPLGIARDDYALKIQEKIDSGQIVVISGPRRSGKSYLMRQALSKQISTKIPVRQSLIVNFEDPRWGNLSTSVLDEIFSTYLKHIHEGGKPFVILDEIQEVPEWEKWVRSIHEREKATILISGSNAKLLSQELGTLLTGRHVDQVVMPLSFGEYLKFHNEEILTTKDILLKRQKSEELFHKMQKNGLFPGVYNLQNPRETLISYYNDVINKDLLGRYKIRNKEEFKILANFFMTNISGSVTWNSSGKFLKISEDSVAKYASHFESVYLLYFLKRYSAKFREKEVSARKVYAFDHGLALAVGTGVIPSTSKPFENYIFSELLKRKGFGADFEIAYWKDDEQREVDFVLYNSSRVIELIQVCWDVSTPKTLQRELRSLSKAMKEFGLSTGLIITNDKEEVVEEKGLQFHFIPAWKWSLLRQIDR